MFRSFKQDYKTGKEAEEIILPIIKTYFNKDIKPTLKKNDKYDFYSDDGYFYELKNRNNKYNTFNTTLIGINKITNNNIIFLFKFIDGLYFIKYNKKLFDTFEKNLFIRNKRIDFKDQIKEYLFIPISELIKINI